MTLALGPAARFAEVVWPGPRYNLAPAGMPPLWVAGVDDRAAAVVHVEWIADPAASPLVPDSAVPPAVRAAVVVDLVTIFGRYREVLDDRANPLGAVRVLTNHPAAVPFLSWVLNETGCRGAVEVRGGGG